MTVSFVCGVLTRRLRVRDALEKRRRLDGDGVVRMKMLSVRR